MLDDPMPEQPAPDFGFDREDPADERDLLVVLPLSNRSMGTHEERAQIEVLADELEQAVQAAGVGEYDGDEYGGGECVLFFCGPDEERLLGTLRKHLQRAPLARGAHFVRLVEAADGEMRRERLRL